MKTNKKVWIKPVVEVQMFAPQDCVAACSPITDARYLDFGGNNKAQLNNGKFDQGEEINSDGYVNGRNIEGIYRNVDSYRSKPWNSDIYSNKGYTYPVVEIRSETDSWWIISWTNYRAYNATS